MLTACMASHILRTLVICSYVLKMTPRARLILYLVSATLIVDVIEGFPHGEWTDEELEMKTRFYKNGQIICQTCPTGYYVLKHCTTSGSAGICEPCDPGKYSEGPSGLTYCQTCIPCKEDKEEVSPCTRKKKNVCQCKSGKYCLPNHPCEMCRDCSESCPKGTVMVHPCNATADIQCAPPSVSNRSLRNIIIAVAVSCVIFLSVSLYMCNAKRLSRTTNKLRLLVPFKSFKEQDVPLDFRPDLTETEKMRDMTQGFYVFHQHVQTNDWEQFMKTLKLTQNQIQEAKLNNHGNVKEQHYSMLETWHQEQAGSVNDLLKALYDMGNGKTALDIKQELVQKKLFVHSN